MVGSSWQLKTGSRGYATENENSEPILPFDTPNRGSAGQGNSHGRVVLYTSDSCDEIFNTPTPIPTPTPTTREDSHTDSYTREDFYTDSYYSRRLLHRLLSREDSHTDSYTREDSHRLLLREDSHTDSYLPEDSHTDSLPHQKTPTPTPIARRFLHRLLLARRLPHRLLLARRFLRL